MAASVTVKPQVSPSIHEGVVAHFFRHQWDADKRSVEPVADDMAIINLAGAVRGVRHAVEAAVDTHEKILADPLHTKLANQARSRKHAFGRFNAAAPKIDAAIRAAEKTVADLQTETDALIAPRRADAHEVQVASEIRAHFRAIRDPAERMQAMHDAVAASDEQTIAALLGGPAYLFGGAVVEQDAMRDGWRLQKFPQQVDRIARIGKAIAAAKRASDAALRFIDGLTPGEAIVRAEEAAERARAAQAA